MSSRKIPVEWLPQYTYADYEAWEGDWELVFGIPFAMSPSPKRIHQSTGRRFVRLAEDALLQNRGSCDCEVYYELDWIVDDNTVVRPDVMIVCGSFEDDFLRFPPSLIVEITSKRTQMADRNIKFKLYESNGVPFYLIADPDRKITEVFQLVNQRYQAVQTTSFPLHGTCRIDMDVNQLWIGNR
jgi:Uma2 family endonuclease